MSAKAGSATNITYQEYLLLLGLSQSDFLTRVLRSDKIFHLRALVRIPVALVDRSTLLPSHAWSGHEILVVLFGLFNQG